MSRRERAWPAGVPCWVDLATTDLDGARDFYGAVLGWDFQVGGPEYGGYTQALVDGAAAAGLGPVMSPDAPVAWTPYFATDDAHATAESVVAAGGQVVFGPMEIPGQGTQLVFADPVGAVSGAWQVGPFIGAGVVNEPGGLSWEDLRSADPDASRAFLTAVFGLEHSSFEGAPEGYTTFSASGEQAPAGAVGPLWGAPAPHWVVYFTVADVDAALATALEHGGAAQGAVDDTPFGRMVPVTDPAGAPFALIQNTGQALPDRS